MNKSVYSFATKTLQGKEISLSDFRGKVLLVVNTATGCGQSPQLTALEKLYQEYKDRGLMVIGFPSDQFNQEPLEGNSIQEHCSINYGVTFPMMEKVMVNGKNAHPLFKFFNNKNENGAIQAHPRWNFYKFLIGRNGEVIDYFWTYRQPGNKKIRAAIEKALG